MSPMRDKFDQRQSVSKVITAKRLSGFCLLISLPVTFFLEGANDWFFLAWLYVLVVYVLPIVLVIWIVVAIDHVGKRRFSTLWFLTISTAVSVLYVLGFTYYPALKELPHSRHIAAQEKAAAIELVEDAPLLHTSGPVGVEIHYRVAFPKGFDWDPRHSAYATLSAPLLGSASALVLTKLTVVPSVSHSFPPGTYVIVEDFTLPFMPPSYLPLNPRTPVALNHCMGWVGDATRERIRSETAQSFVVDIPISMPSYHRATKRTYLPLDFYNTALREGATDCTS